MGKAIERMRQNLDIADQVEKVLKAWWKNVFPDDNSGLEDGLEVISAETTDDGILLGLLIPLEAEELEKVLGGGESS